SFFSEKQIAALNDVAADRLEETFLHLWTQLEAQGKARATGIGQANRYSSESNAFDGKCLSFTRSLPGPGYVVGLAVQGWRNWSLRIRGLHTCTALMGLAHPFCERLQC